MAAYLRGRAMPPTLEQLGLDRVSPEDRLAVAEAIWDSVADEAAAAPLTPAQRAELERRLADSLARPEAVTPWEVVKGRLAPGGDRWSSCCLQVSDSVS